MLLHCEHFQSISEQNTHTHTHNFSERTIDLIRESELEVERVNKLIHRVCSHSQTSFVHTT